MYADNVFAEAVLPKNYSLQGFTIYKETIVRDKPKVIRVSDAIMIEKVHQDAETMAQKLDLVYHTGKSGIKRITVNAESLNSRHIEDLSKFGLDISANNKNEVNEFLLAQRKLLQSNLSYQSVGWIQIDDQKYFALDRILVPRNSGSATLESRQYQLKPTGTHYQINDLNSPIGHDIANNVNLQLGIVLGMSAALVPIINDFNPDIGTLIYALKGQSTSGKTTTAQLAASVAGPISGQGSLFNSWRNTQNAITIKLNNNFGIPLVYDELSVYHGNNMTSLLYNINQGLEKARANKNGDIRDQKRWQTIVISTGEQSIIEKSSQNDGILARTLEFEVDHWTNSASQSERIKRFVTQNNGWWMRDFIEAVFGGNLQSGIDLVAEIFEQQKQIALTQMPAANLKERLASKVAVIGTTAKLMNEKMDFAVNADEIQRLVIQYCKLEQSVDVGERAFSDVLQYLISNQRKIKTNGLYVEPNLIGFFDTSNSNFLQINILANELKRILADLNYEDSNIIIKKWVSNDHLITGNDRLVVRKQLNKQRVKFYQLKLTKEEATDFVMLSEDERRKYQTITSPQSTVNQQSTTSPNGVNYGSTNFDVQKATQGYSSTLQDIQDELT